MTRFIKTIEGFVHSVPDDYKLFEGQTEASRKDADDALLGKGGEVVQEKPTVTAPAAISDDIHTVGAVDPRKLDIEPPTPNQVFPDGKPEEYPNGTDPVANATPVGEVAPTDTVNPDGTPIVEGAA